MNLIVFAAFILALTAAIFGLHIVRTRFYRGPYVMLFTLLWVMSFLTGSLGYKLDLVLLGWVFEVRYSSSIFALIFVMLLLVYICEGTAETRNLILVAIGAQASLALLQLFLHKQALEMLGTEGGRAAELVFRPSYLRMLVSLLAAAVDVFLAVAVFQFLVNRARWIPLAITLFIALSITLTVDSVIFLGGTRPERFFEQLPSHVLVKTAIVALVMGPMSLYVRWFQGHSHVDLNRGSLDIFRRIETLEQDLAKANTELRRYADSLEEMVEDRTRVIREKQAVMDLEMRMAAEIQDAMLPAAAKLPGIPIGAIYLPASGVSGDLYDFGKYDTNGLFFFAADISGHGVPASMVGSMSAMSLSRINLRDSDPASILGRLSDEIQGLSGSHYLTAVFLKIHLETREITYANGAHVPPVLLGPSGKSLFLEPTGSLLGADMGAQFGTKKIVYKPGTRLVLYTDGITEHRTIEKDEFGRERLLASLHRLRSQPPQDVCGTLVSELREFAPGVAFTDDVTMVIADLP